MFSTMMKTISRFTMRRFSSLVNMDEILASAHNVMNRPSYLVKKDQKSIGILPRSMIEGNGKRYQPEHVILGPLNYLDYRLKDTLMTMETVKSATVATIIGDVDDAMKSLYTSLVSSSPRTFNLCASSTSSEFLKEVQLSQDFYDLGASWSYLDDRAFSLMMFRDSLFVLHCLIKNPQQPNSPLSRSIMENTLKLHNQIPLSLVRKMHAHLKLQQGEDFDTLVYRYLTSQYSFPYVNIPKEEADMSQEADLLGCLHRYVMGTGEDLELSTQTMSTMSSALECRPSARELSKACIQFKPLPLSGGMPGIRHIRFEKESRTLYLPGLWVGYETKWRNLVGHEYFLSEQRSVRSFLCLLGDLIQSPSDLELLQRSGVLRNMRSDKDIDDVRDLCQVGAREPCEVIEKATREMMGEYRSKMKKWRRVSISFDGYVHDHPWVVISAAAGLFMISMTTVQVLCLFFDLGQLR